MNEHFPADDLKQLFLQLDGKARQQALVAYGHELTILARMHFSDGEVDGARACNESLHRLMGHLRAQPEDARAQESFIGMTVEVAQRRGWTQILRQALAQAASTT